MHKKVNQIWELQIKFDELLSDLQGDADNHTTILIKNLDSVCQNIIVLIFERANLKL